MVDGADLRMEEVWMDGWTDGWMDGWMDGWTDGWMDGRTDGWMHVLKHKGDVSLMQAVGSPMFSADGAAQGKLNDDSRALMSPNVMGTRCVSDI